MKSKIESYIVSALTALLVCGLILHPYITVAVVSWLIWGYGLIQFNNWLCESESERDWKFETLCFVLPPLMTAVFLFGLMVDESFRSMLWERIPFKFCLPIVPKIEKETKGLGTFGELSQGAQFLRTDCFNGVDRCVKLADNSGSWNTVYLEGNYAGTFCQTENSAPVTIL